VCPDEGYLKLGALASALAVDRGAQLKRGAGDGGRLLQRLGRQQRIKPLADQPSIDCGLRREDTRAKGAAKVVRAQRNRTGAR
jgi:hypothetical protein